MTESQSMSAYGNVLDVAAFPVEGGKGTSKYSVSMISSEGSNSDGSSKEVSMEFVGEDGKSDEMGK
jgi:hypothetical protein